MILSADSLDSISGAAGFGYGTVSPDVVRLSEIGGGLSYEIMQLTPSLNAIYSYTRKYSDDLPRYVTYR